MSSKQIGKQEAFSAIATADAETITVRGKDLCSELIGRISFGDYYFFLLTGQEPTRVQSVLLNATLVTVAEHGLTVTAQASRMTYDADPGFLQGAVAAGILGAGSVVLGTSEQCGRMLNTIVTDAASLGRSVEASARAVLQDLKARRQAVPGFGHHLHSGGDPRTERLLSLAAEHQVRGAHCEALLAVERLLPEVFGKPLVANASAAIPAVLLDVGFPIDAMKGIPILARTASLLAHLHEERTRPIGFLMAHHGKKAITYDGPSAHRSSSATP